MRLVKVAAEAGLGKKIIETAFAAGIKQVSTREVVTQSSDGGKVLCDVVDIETSTPVAKKFVDLLLAADYYDVEKISLNTRQPRSIISAISQRELTKPLVEPAVDLFAELWQFSHITYGLIGRIFISACLLSYGLIGARILLIVAGLLFLPVLPMLMAVSFGIAGRQFRLAMQGLAALTVSALTLVAGGALIAYLCQPPMRFDELSTPGIGLLISAAVGVAAALAAEDDAGRRELIGLAAAAQIGMVPAMIGILLVYGSPPMGESVWMRLVSFIANVAAIITTVLVTQYFTGVIGRTRRVDAEGSPQR